MGLLHDNQDGGDWWSQYPVHDDGTGIDPSGAGGFTGMGNGGTVPVPQPGTPAGQNVTIDQLKQLIGNDYSAANLTRLLPQLQAMGVEVQNQGQVIPGTRDLRPRFRLPNGDQWDFGDGGWINSAKNVGPGFKETGGSNPLAAPTGNKSILDFLRDTPGYKFTVEEGVNAIDRAGAAIGNLRTGGTMKRLLQWGQGNADTTYGNELDRYRQAALLGQNSVNGQNA